MAAESNIIIEQRLRNYLLQISEEELDSSELISNIIEEINDWWETDDDNLSDIASRRRKIEAVTGVVTNLVITYWKKADDSFYDAVQRAIEANLYDVIAKRQKVRKSVSAKHNAYIAAMVKKKLFAELPRTAPDTSVQFEPNVNGRDDSDETVRNLQASILRTNPSRPSVNPVVFGDPLRRNDVSLLGLLQPPSVNVPSLNIDIGDVQINAVRLVSDPDDILMANIAMPEPIPNLTPFVPDLDQPDVFNQSAAIEVAPIMTDEPNATLEPDSNSVDSSLPPVRLSQISPIRKRRPNQNVIIDRVTTISDYASRSIKLNRSQQIKRCDPNWCELKKIKNATSVTRFFSSPACAPMYNSVRAEKLNNLFTRHLLVHPSNGVPSVVHDVPPQPDTSIAREQQQEGRSIRMGQTRGSVRDLIASAEPQNLVAETSPPVTVIRPSLDGITANVHILAPVDTRLDVSSDNFRSGANETRNEILAASEVQTQVPAANDIQVPDGAGAEPSIAAQTEISAVNDAQILPNEIRVETTAETEVRIPPARQIQTEDPVVQHVETLFEIPIVDDDMPLQNFSRLSITELLPNVIAADRDMQEPRNEFHQNNIEFIDLLQENTLTPLKDLIAYMKLTKIAVVKKLLQLNRLWQVRLKIINNEVFVTKFPEGTAEKLRNECA